VHVRVDGGRDREDAVAHSRRPVRDRAGERKGLARAGPVARLGFWWRWWKRRGSDRNSGAIGSSRGEAAGVINIGALLRKLRF
jgi:hypothetical protein